MFDFFEVLDIEFEVVEFIDEESIVFSVCMCDYSDIDVELVCSDFDVCIINRYI